MHEDRERIISERVNTHLQALANAIASFGTSLVDSGLGIPVRITDEPSNLQISIKNHDDAYPHTAKSIARRIKRSQNWVAKSVRKLGLIGDPKYHSKIGGYKAPLHRYSPACVDRLIQEVSANPSFDPYST